MGTLLWEGKTKDMDSCSSQKVFGGWGGESILLFPCPILEVKMSTSSLGGASQPPNCWLNLDPWNLQEANTHHLGCLKKLGPDPQLASPRFSAVAKNMGSGETLRGVSKSLTLAGPGLLLLWHHRAGSKALLVQVPPRAGIGGTSQCSGPLTAQDDGGLD